MLGLGQGFTAHPRIDPASGTLAGFSWASKLDQSAVLATVREWDQGSGRPAHATRVELAGSLAPHDFAITPSWYVFAHNAMALEVLPFVAGLKGPVRTAVHTLCTRCAHAVHTLCTRCAHALCLRCRDAPIRGQRRS